MKIKAIKVITFLLLLSLVVIRHKTLDANRGQITLLQLGARQVVLIKRKADSKKLADYMYKRIEHYQKYEGWYDRTIELWENYLKEK